MRSTDRRGVRLATLIVLSCSSACLGHALAETGRLDFLAGAEQPAPTIPGLPTVPMPPGIAIPPDGSGLPRLAMPPVATPAQGESPSAAARPAAAAAHKDAEPPKSPQAVLDELFGRLGKSTDAAESQGIAGAIERVWMRSGSDTADLLMQRALSAVEAKDLALGETLLTSVVKIDPTWAEAWNKRATVRYMRDDTWGAMADLAEVLAREPRHFGALTGMAAILQRAGLDKDALQVYRKVLALYPQLDGIRAAVDKLRIDVEGRDI
jgi:tetratricopeptide (TPR) repeat protein